MMIAIHKKTASWLFHQKNEDACCYDHFIEIVLFYEIVERTLEG